jgi:hypothetical protein
MSFCDHIWIAASPRRVGRLPFSKLLLATIGGRPFRPLWTSDLVLSAFATVRRSRALWSSRSSTGNTERPHSCEWHSSPCNSNLTAFFPSPGPPVQRRRAFLFVHRLDGVCCCPDRHLMQCLIGNGCFHCTSFAVRESTHREACTDPLDRITSGQQALLRPPASRDDTTPAAAYRRDDQIHSAHTSSNTGFVSLARHARTDTPSRPLFLHSWFGDFAPSDWRLDAFLTGE